MDYAANLIVEYTESSPEALGEIRDRLILLNRRQEILWHLRGWDVIPAESKARSAYHKPLVTNARGWDADQTRGG